MNLETSSALLPRHWLDDTSLKTQTFRERVLRLMMLVMLMTVCELSKDDVYQSLFHEQITKIFKVGSVSWFHFYKR